MRRSLLLLALGAGAALTTTAQAQTGPGHIYYQYGSPTVTYKVAGDGTQNAKVNDSPAPRVSALSTYPGGRQFQYGSAVIGTIPGTTTGYADMTLLAETTGVETTISNYRGPQWMVGGSGYYLSNDHQDSFFSFRVYDSRTGNTIVYRYNGPLADVFAPGFVPFTSDDARLTAILSLPKIDVMGGWDGTGTRLFFQVNQTTSPYNKLLYVLDVTTGTTTLINNPAVSGLNMDIGHCSSTELRLFALATTATVQGIVSFYPATGRYTWVIQQGGNPSKWIDHFTEPAISPDGTVLAFGLFRSVGGLVCPTLARVPASSGSYTPLVTFPGFRRPPADLVKAIGWTW